MMVKMYRIGCIANMIYHYLSSLSAVMSSSGGRITPMIVERKMPPCRNARLIACDVPKYFYGTYSSM